MIKKDDLDRKQEAISSEIEAKVPFEDLDYVSSIKLANIKLRILTSLSLSFLKFYSSQLLKKSQYRGVSFAFCLK